jgi:two-component system response regulator FixJ
MRVNKNIFLVDDDAAACCALSVFLVNSGYSVKSFHSAEAFLEEADSVVEGVMLLDQRMTGMSGMELQAELPKRGIDLAIIFVTGHGDVQMSVKAVKAGAIDFLEKPFSNEHLLSSIKEAFSRVNNRKKQRGLTDKLRKCHASLTEREREVLKHVAAGKSNRDIAELLGLSNRTIEVHRSKLKKKMGAESLPELVRKYDMCQKAGLL